MRRAVLAGLVVTAAAAPAVAAPPPRGLVANNQSPANRVGTFDPVGLTSGPNIDVGGDNLWVAPSPDGSKAYVQNVYPAGRLSVLDLTTTPLVVDHADDNGALTFGALSPDGRTAYLSGGNVVTPVDLTTSPPTVRSSIGVTGAGYITVTPDGTKAYVGTPSGVVPVDLVAGTAGSAIATGAGVYGLASAPDGSTVWVANHDARTVSALPVAGGAPVPIDVSAAGHPALVAASADGRRVYVVMKEEHRLAWIDTATKTLAGDVDLGTSRALAIAVSPDGRTVFVSDGSLNGTGAGSVIVPVDVSGVTPIVEPAMGGFVDPSWIGLTPDQPPTANFTVRAAPPGSATSFDATDSLAGTTPTVRYDWDFGDGTSGTSAGPAIDHVYAHAGTYAAAVTQTDAAGTSTTRVFTGQQVLRNGGPAARAARTVVIAAGGTAQPQVALAPGRLDFGLVGVGHATDAQTVTVRNTGDGALHLGTPRVDGPFRATADGCGGTTVDPGASCTVGVTFAPTTPGTLTGSLAFDDDAAGSPHTVLLAGTATARANLAGTVRNAAVAGAPPVVGARLSVCLYGTHTSCSQAVTGADGRYDIREIAPGRYQVEVLPPAGANLTAGAAVVALAAGEPKERDIFLSAPDRLSPGLTIDGQTGGPAPVGFWLAPRDVRTPLVVPDARPGTFGMTEVSFYTAPDGATGVDGQAAASATIVYAFDDDGVPRFVSMIEHERAARAKTGQAAAGGGVPPIGTWTLGLSEPPVRGRTDVRLLSVSGVLAPTLGAPFHGQSRFSVQQRPKAFTFGATAPGAEPIIDPGPVIPDYVPSRDTPRPPDSGGDAVRSARDFADKEYGKDKDYSDQSPPGPKQTTPQPPPG